MEGSINYRLSNTRISDGSITTKYLNIPTYMTVPPKIQPKGSLIYVISDKNTYVSDGTTWLSISSSDLSPALQSIAGLTTTADDMIYTIAGNTYATTKLTSAGRNLLDDASAADQRVTLGLNIGTDVQAFDPGLQSISLLTTGPDKMIYTTAPDTYNTTDLTPQARNFLAASTTADQRTSLGLGSISVLPAPSGDVVGTTDIQTLTNKTMVDTSNDIEATRLRTTTGNVVIANATPPNAGYVLTAVSPTAANWQQNFSGDLSGPASATDNAIARFDTTTGKLVQNSGVLIDDSNNITGISNLTASTLTGTLQTSNQPNITNLGTLSNLSVTNNITVGGTVDGVDIAALQADVNGFPDELKNLTTAEIQQLENIGTTTISGTQWGYLGNMNQSVSTADTPTFNGLSANNQKITDVLTPTSANDATNKSYVDTVAGAGLTILNGVALATDAILPDTPTYTSPNETLTSSVNNFLTVDSTSAVLNSRILVKNQSDDRENGVYVVTDTGSVSTPWILTRASDFNQAATPINVNSAVFVSGGTINQNSTWVLSATVNTIDPLTDSVNFSQFSGSTNLTAGTGMTQTGNVFNVNGTINRISVNSTSVDIDTNYVGQPSINTLGTITTGIWNSNNIDISYGGTGASDAPTARTNLGLAIGTDVQAYSNALQSISGLVTSPDQMIYTTALDTYSTTPLTSQSRILLSDATAADQRNTLGLGSIAVLPAPLGDVVGTTDTQTLSNKTLIDDSTIITDNIDNTKNVKFEVGNISSLTTRTLSIPDANGEITLNDAVQSLTNKTIIGNTNTVEATDLSTTGASVNISGAAPPVSGQLLTATGPTSAIWQTFNVDVGRRLVVAISGGNYTSIQSAITAAISMTPTAINPILIQVYPGVYAETNPIIIPQYVTVRGMGRNADVIVTPTTSTTAAIFQMSGNSALFAVTVNGANGIGGIGVNAPSSIPFCSIRNVSANNVDIAFRCSGVDSIMLADYCSAFSTSTSNVGTGFIVENSGTMRCSNCTASGLLGMNIAYGYICQGPNSMMNLFDVNVSYADTAFLCDEGTLGNLATMILVGGRASATSVDAIKIGQYSTGNFSSMTAYYSLSGNELNLSTDTSTFIGIGNQIRSDKIIRIPGSTLIDQSISNIPGDEGIIMRAELQVGVFNDPRESSFGGGDSYTTGEYIFTADTPTGPFTDHTTESISYTGSTFNGFNGTGAGNTLYIGGSMAIYRGIKIILTGSMDLGTGTVIPEYWDGSTWSQLYFMSVDCDYPYYPHAQQLFQLGQYQYRFGNMNGFTTSIINGILAYWVRFRIVTAINTVPVIEQIKLHSIRTEIESDGMITFFSRYPTKRERLNYYVMSASPESNPGNQNIYLSDTINITYVDNKLRNNQNDRIVCAFPTPKNLFTAIPLKIKVIWQNNSAGGNVELVVRNAYTSDYADDTSNVSSLYTNSGDSPTTSPNQLNQTFIVTAPSVINKQTTNTFTINYFDVLGERNGGEGDTLWMSIERNGSAISDSYNGDVNIAVLYLEYKVWNVGSYNE